MFKIRQDVYEALPAEERAEVDEGLRELEELRRRNPLQLFEPHSGPQREFFEASTKVIAAFAGNRFGKTTSLVVRSLIEVVDAEVLPDRLRRVKQFGPADGWILCPTEEKIFDTMHPAFKRWCPASQLKGGVWAKAWNGERMQLSFANGSTISFKTYKQDPSTLGGAALHFVGYDEPPPQDHREECLTRLDAAGSYEMFAMTPLKSNTGWIRREIFKKREAPEITVVKGTIHDNPTLDKKSVEWRLSQYRNDLWRRARELGEFVDVGGLIYAGFEECVISAPSPESVQSWDVMVGIDPGIRNAGFVFGGFDSDNSLTVFDELLLQDATVEQYVDGIRNVLEKWGVTEASYVIDPAARSRTQVNAESVASALARLGVFCADGQNQVEAGVQQVRGRITHKRLRVSAECVGLRDEADEYAAEDRPDGEFQPIKQHDHRLDALRYVCMQRPWYPWVEAEEPARRLGAVVQGVAQPWESDEVRDHGPMGTFS